MILCVIILFVIVWENDGIFFLNEINWIMQQSAAVDVAVTN